MYSANLRSRRLFILSWAVLVCTGCGKFPYISTKKVRVLTPEQTLNAYFSYLSAGRSGDAVDLMSSTFQERLGRDGVNALLHSVKSVQVTEVVDAVEWANRLGARLPAPPADRREYLVTLEVKPSSDGTRAWSAGTNRRFIDLVQQGGLWKIDAIASSPGVLVTGQQSQGDNQVSAVVPIAPLWQGPVPIDQALYTARQNAVDRGAIPWATDPIEVVHHDGPSFGLYPIDPAEVLVRDKDPTSLVPRVLVRVEQKGQQYLVTLIQPIRSGDGGVWAISDVESYASPSR